MKGKRVGGERWEAPPLGLDGPVSVEEGGASGVHTRIGYLNAVVGTDVQSSVNRISGRTRLSVDSLTSTYNRRLVVAHPSLVVRRRIRTRAGSFIFSSLE